MNSGINIKYINWLPFGLVMLFVLALQLPYINVFPTYSHAWAMTDHLAIAQGFINNGFDLFSPQNYVLNKQFPHSWSVAYSSGVTSVDFPIHNLLVAMFMKLFNTQEPWLFRGYFLGYYLIGLGFLYQLFLTLSSSRIKAFVICFLAASAPLMVYFQSAFLPTVPSLTNTIIGVFFYYRYLNTNNSKSFGISVLFLTLAGLSRTTFLIPLIAVFSVEVLRVFAKHASLKKTWPSIMASILVILGYFWFNQTLTQKHGSVFLKEFKTPESIDEASQILANVYEYWALTFFSEWHYWAFLVVIILVVASSLWRGLNVDITTLTLLFVFGFQMIGSLLFATLMLRQFSAHEYYFLDSFYLPIVFGFGWLISVVTRPKPTWLNYIGLGLIVVLLVPMGVQAFKFQEQKHALNFLDRYGATEAHFNGEIEFLKSQGLADNAKILVLEPYAPNMPFIKMNRSGYIVMNCTQASIERALLWNPDLIVVQKEFFYNDVFVEHPELIKRVEVVYNRPSLVYFKPVVKRKSFGLKSFLGLKPEMRVWQEHPTDNNNPMWNNLFKPALNDSDSIFEIKLDNDYGLEFNTSLTSENRAAYLVFESEVEWQKKGELRLIAQYKSEGEVVLLRSFKINMENSESNIFQLIDLSYLESTEGEFQLFFWNLGKSHIRFKNASVTLYRAPT